MKKCAEFSKEATSEVTKEEPIPEKLEEEHIESRATPSVDSPYQMKQPRELCQV
jgi:hypothetical protein